MQNAFSNLQVENGRIVFDASTSLQHFVENARDQDFANEYAPSLRKYEAQGFSSLTPLLKEHEVDRIAKYKESKLARLKVESSMNGRTFYEEELDDEDEFIADSYFASLLNEKREIQIEGMIYKYTEYGAFFTKKEGIDKLYQYLDKASSKELVNLPAGQNTEVVPGIYFFKQDYRSGVQDSYQYESDEFGEDAGLITANSYPKDDSGGPGGSSGGASRPPSAPDPLSLSTCGNMNSNLITKIFGPALTCHSNFDSKNRIRVRAWNQNFLIYSSLGIKVKSQKKNIFGIWLESNIDELILGIDAASFKVPARGSLPPYNNAWYSYSYNGYLVDQYGNISKKNYFPQKPFKNFPVSDRNQKFISIYAFGGLVDYDLTGGKINGYAKKGVKSAVKALGKVFKTSELNGKPAVITQQSTDRNFYVTIANYKKSATNKSRIEEVFDFNILMKFTFNPSTISSVGDIKPEPISYDYKELKISAFGMGRRYNRWQGKRINYNEKR